MKIELSKSKFKAKALEYFRKIELTGDTIIITDHGEPTLEIKPYKTRNALDVLKDTVVTYDSPTSPVAEDDWENT